MALPKIQVLLDDGPHTGEIVEVAARPDGTPPEQIVVTDPLAADGQPDEGTAIGTEISGATEYHLHEKAGSGGAAVYRTGVPD